MTSADFYAALVESNSDKYLCKQMRFSSPNLRAVFVTSMLVVAARRNTCQVFFVRSSFYQSRIKLGDCHFGMIPCKLNGADVT